MICEDDLILAKRAMETSEKRVGYVLKSRNGKRYVSNISENEVFEKAINEHDFKYILIYSQNKNIKKIIDIDYISKKVDKDFKIYFINKGEIEEYKL